jgi:hypothetical protein
MTGARSSTPSDCIRSTGFFTLKTLESCHRDRVSHHPAACDTGILESDLQATGWITDLFPLWVQKIRRAMLSASYCSRRNIVKRLVLGEGPDGLTKPGQDCREPMRSQCVRIIWRYGTCSRAQKVHHRRRALKKLPDPPSNCRPSARWSRLANQYQWNTYNHFTGIRC